MSGVVVDFQKYKCLIENNPDGVCEIDLQGRILDVNGVFAQLTGRTKSELVQLSLMDLLFADDASAKQELDLLVQGAHRNHNRLRVRHKEGHPIQILCTTVPIIVNDDVIGLYMIVKDISQQKTVDELLGISQSMLAYSQRIAHVGSWEFDPVRQRSLWSAELFNIYGLPNTEYISLTEAYRYIHPEDKERFMESAQALAEGQPYDIEFRIVRPDGNVRYVHSRREMCVSNGEVHLIGTAQDITDQKQTQELLLQSEKLSVVGQMAAGVAHEIRNPLTALKGFVQLLHPQSADTHRQYFEIMQMELNRIQQILDELLMLAKPQSVKYTCEDVCRLLQEVIALMDAQAIMQQVNIKCRYSMNLPRVNCVPNQLKQVFVNVMKNAIEAMPAGGTLSIRLKYKKTWVEIEFSDEGVGIPAEKLSKLGEPFYTTKEKGTGLGLMVSHRIIHTHGGNLQIVSGMGKGTTVRILLPAVSQ
ncbi:PAS domain-containing sensor histidine kinase [Alicyclobacillus ferrooxydans]|nr:PAS domain S-box protein [Alicyclobacillus ferrooxydans]